MWPLVAQGQKVATVNADDKLWVRFPLEETKYSIFSFPRFGNIKKNSAFSSKKSLVNTTTFLTSPISSKPKERHHNLKLK